MSLEKSTPSPKSWQLLKKLKEIGEEGLTHGLTNERLAIIKKLEKENQALKEIIAKKELESKFKDELLKKKYPHLRNML